VFFLRDANLDSLISSISLFPFFRRINPGCGTVFPFFREMPRSLYVELPAFATGRSSLARVPLLSTAFPLT